MSLLRPDVIKQHKPNPLVFADSCSNSICVFFPCFHLEHITDLHLSSEFMLVSISYGHKSAHTTSNTHKLLGGMLPLISLANVQTTLSSTHYCNLLHITRIPYWYQDILHWYHTDRKHTIHLHVDSVCACWLSFGWMADSMASCQLQQIKNTIHQVTTMLVTSKNVLFPGYSHLLTTGTDDPLLGGAWAIIKVWGHQYRWLAGDYDLEIGHFWKWLAWWLPRGYWVFFCTVLASVSFTSLGSTSCIQTPVLSMMVSLFSYCHRNSTWFTDFHKSLY